MPLSAVITVAERVATAVSFCSAMLCWPGSGARLWTTVWYAPFCEMNLSLNPRLIPYVFDVLQLAQQALAVHMPQVQRRVRQQINSASRNRLHIQATSTQETALLLLTRAAHCASSCEIASSVVGEALAFSCSQRMKSNERNLDSHLLLQFEQKLQQRRFVHSDRERDSLLIRFSFCLQIVKLIIARPFRLEAR